MRFCGDEAEEEATETLRLVEMDRAESCGDNGLLVRVTETGD